MLRLPVHADGMSVTSVGFSADGKRVVSAGDDGTVRVATIDPEMLIHRVTSYTKVCVPISVWVDRIRKDSTEARDRLAKCEKKWHPIEPDR
jgi:WD40 repeat protein